MRNYKKKQTIYVTVLKCLWERGKTEQQACAICQDRENNKNENKTKIAFYSVWLC